jgi:hypothetical protein
MQELYIKLFLTLNLNFTLSEGLAGDAWELSEQKLSFLTPPRSVVSFATLPNFFSLSLSLNKQRLFPQYLAVNCEPIV